MADFKIDAIVETGGAIGPADKLDKSLGKVVDTAEGAQKKVGGLGGAFKDLGESIGLPVINLKNFQSGLRDVSQGLTTVGTGIAAFGAGITAGLGVAAARAIDFEQAFAGVRKTVDESEENLGRLRQRFIDLSTEIPVSASELAALGETAGQLGIKGVDNIEAFALTIADLGVSSNIAGQEGATMLARFSAVTGDERYRQLANVIVDLGNNSRTSEAEILALAQRLSSAGTTAGLSSDQILGMAAALSSVGIEAEAGGSAFSKLTIEIASAVAQGGSKLEEFASVAGVSADAFSRQFGENGAKAIALFTAGLGRIKEEGGDVFTVLENMGLTEVRLRNAILSTANAQDKFVESIDRAAVAITNTNAINKESQAFYATTENQLKILVQTFDALAIEIGSTVLPTIVSLAQSARDVVVPIIEWARANPELTKTAVELGVVLGGGAIGAGGLLLIVGTLAGSIANIIPLLGGLQKALYGTGAAGAAAAGGLGKFGVLLGGLLAQLGQQKILQEAAELAVRKTADAFGIVTVEAGAYDRVNAAINKTINDLHGNHDRFIEDFKKEVAERHKAAQGTDDYKARIEAAARAQEAAKKAAEELAKAIETQQKAVDEANTAYNTFDSTLLAFAASQREMVQGIRDVAELQSIHRGVAESLQAIERPADIAATSISEVTSSASSLGRTLESLAARDLSGQIFSEMTLNSINLNQNLGHLKGGLEALGNVALQERDAMGQFTGEMVKVEQQSSIVNTTMSQVSTAVTDLGKSIANLIIEGGSIVDVFKAFGETLLRIASEQVIGFLIGKLGDLLSSLGGVGSALGGLLGSGASVAGQVGGSVGGAVGSGAGGAGGVAGSVGGAAGSGATAVIGAVASVGSLISGIIGNFQNARQETTLNAIEENTRKGTLYLGDRGDGGIIGVSFRILEQLEFGNIVKAIEDLRNKFWDTVPVWRAIESHGAYVQPTLDHFGSAYFSSWGSKFDAIDRNTERTASSLERLGDALRSGGAGVEPIPQLATGGRITRDGFAFVHRGETVTPGSASGSMPITFNAAPIQITVGAGANARQIGRAVESARNSSDRKQLEQLRRSMERNRNGLGTAVRNLR